MKKILSFLLTFAILLSMVNLNFMVAYASESTANYAPTSWQAGTHWYNNGGRVSATTDNHLGGAGFTVSKGSSNYQFVDATETITLLPNTNYRFFISVKGLTAQNKSLLEKVLVYTGGAREAAGSNESFPSAQWVASISNSVIDSENSNDTWLRLYFDFTTNSSTTYDLRLKWGNISSFTISDIALYAKAKLSLSTNGNGSVASLNNDVFIGQTVTLTATPNEGEEFLGWYSGDKILSTDAVYNHIVSSASETLTAEFTRKKVSLMDENIWGVSGRDTNATIEKINDIITVQNVQWDFFYLPLYLEKSTSYSFNFDFRSQIQLEKLYIVPASCGIEHKADGNYAGYDVNAGLLLKSYTGVFTTANTWYENNSIEFVTNGNENEYYVIFKTASQLSGATGVSPVELKNVSVSPLSVPIKFYDVSGNEISDIKRIITPKTTMGNKENGIAEFSIIYDDMEGMLVFDGWFLNDELFCKEEKGLISTNAYDISDLTAKITVRNVLLNASGFEGYENGTSLRVSPANSGTLPYEDKWGIWSAFANEGSPGYECVDHNFPIKAVTGEITDTYFENWTHDLITGTKTTKTNTYKLTPHSGNGMMSAAICSRSIVRKIENLTPNTNYKLSFYVCNPDKWNYLYTATLTDTANLRTNIIANKHTTVTDKIYGYYIAETYEDYYETDTVLRNDASCRNWEKVIIDFTTDNATEVYLHLGFVNKNADSSRCKFYFDDMVCYESIIDNAGNAIRGKDSALRYKFSVPNEMLNSYKGFSTKKIGILAIPTEHLGGEDLVIGGNYTDKEYTPREGVVNENNYQYADGDSLNTYFTAALYGINAKDYSTKISVRPYIIYQRNDGSLLTMYGDTVSVCMFDVMYAIKSRRISDADLKIVDGILSNNDVKENYISWQPKDYFYMADSKLSAEDYEYSFAVVGDVQYTTQYHSSDLPKIYDYILDNKDSKKIQYVLGMGDNTNNSTDIEFANITGQFNRLNSAGIPMVIARGNHDTETQFDRYITVEKYGKALSGTYDGTMKNTYRKINIGGIKYLMMSLDYNPDANEIAWAKEVADANKDYNVILTTHSYLEAKMNYSTDGGSKLLSGFVDKCENVVMVLCGHNFSYGPAIRTHERESGRKVVQMMVNFQQMEFDDNVSYGALLMLYFSNGGKTVTTEFFSTVRDNEYFRECNQYSFELDLVG